VTADGRLPVVVGTGQSIERRDRVTALDLAERAAVSALEGVPHLRRQVEQVCFVNSVSPVGPAPATALARRLGLTPRRAEVSTLGGNSPQWLVNRAAAAIAAGEVDVVLVAGAEAQRSARSGPSTVGAGEEESAPPDVVVGDDRPPLSGPELEAGLLAPVDLYAMFESALAQQAGRGFAEQRRVLGALMAPFTAVASTHRYAWFPETRTAPELATPGPRNRLVSEPYPKAMCAMLGVDQGAAVVLASLDAARRRATEDGAVFCWSGAQCTDVWLPTARPDPGASPALGAAIAAALEAAGSGVDDVGLFDLYSCFPCAVELAVAALGLEPDDPRDLTVTGGLPYFGGPGNNYSLHAVATMVDRLRRDGGTGLVTALGWYLTKHAAGLYGADPPPGGWQTGDTTAARRDIEGDAVEIAAEATGGAVVLAATLSMGRDGQVAAAPVIARLDDGRHVAAAAAVTELPALGGRNLVGTRVEVGGRPLRYRTPD